MIKNISVVLALSVLLTACGGSDNNNSSKSSSSVAVSSSSVKSSSVAMTSSSVAPSSSSVAPSSSSVAPSSSSVAPSSSSESSSSVASSVSTAATDLYYDFEADAVGTANAVSGYGGNTADSAIATVVDGTAFETIPAQVDSLHVLKVISKNYHSGAKFTMVLPAGKTLADYDISFDLYMPTKIDADFKGGDNGYKTLNVVAGSSITSFMNDAVVLGAVIPDSGGATFTYDLIGQAKVGWGATTNVANNEYAADQWVNITIPTGTKGENVSGTFELGFGMPRAGATADTDFYLIDNILLTEKP